MKKRLKLLLYGEPGVGKSSFAVRLPKPFFLTTDGNYEWLDCWGAKEEDHVKIDSWKSFKEELGKIKPEYETIVVDLLEDLFKWSEQEFCIEAGIKHISHLPWSEGYDRQRTDFTNTLNRLINEDKNVIFIMHQTAISYKDRRGVEKTSFRPSNRIPDKVLDVIEGRMNVLRCYLTADQDEDGNPIKKRMLSLIPKENEWAILRGVNENSLPQDVELDPDLFCNLLKLNDTQPVKTTAKVETKQVTKPVEKAKEEPKQVEEKETFENPKVEMTEVKTEAKPEVKEEPKQEEVKQTQTVQETSNKPTSVDELRARILAKLKNKNN